MPKVSVTTIKAWFNTGDTPTEEQFANVFDSYIHKDDGIAVGDVSGLSAALNAKANVTDLAAKANVTALSTKADLVAGIVKEDQIPDVTDDTYESKYLLINNVSVEGNKAKFNGKKIREGYKGDHIVYYAIGHNPVSGTLFPVTKNGAMTSATITPNGICDDIDVTGGNQDSYVTFTISKNNDAYRHRLLRVKVTRLGTAPLLGIRNIYIGNNAHNNTAPNALVAWVNLLTNTVYYGNGTYSTTGLSNTVAPIAAVGDVLTIRLSFDFVTATYNLFVYNETTSCYVNAKWGTTPKMVFDCGFGSAHPAVIIADGGCTLIDFRVFSDHTFSPPVGILGDSMGSGYNITYADTVHGKLMSKLPFPVVNFTGPGQQMEGMHRCLKGLFDIKPKAVLLFNFLGMYYGYFNSADANYPTYIVQFRGVVDAIKSYGGVPVFIKVSTWQLVTPSVCTAWNAFIDGEVALNGGLVLDLTTETPTYDSSGYHYNGAFNNILADRFIALLEGAGLL